VNAAPDHRRRRFIPIAILSALVVGIGLSAYFGWQAKLSAEATRREKLEADKAVLALPAGTEEAWLAHVDRRLATAIQSQAGAFAVTSGPGLSDETKLVSRNTPYQVTCSPYFGGSVEFGSGDNSVVVRIFDFLADKTVDDAPLLGVSKQSIAASDLSRTLCARISAALSRMAIRID
jgi:hypothetical protein